jgi:carboxyl-terminal processing protease
MISKKNVRLIDVRTPKEYAEGHIKGAENIDVKAADFSEKTKNVKGNVAVYCARGVRSLNAANTLAAQGCTVYNLDGGLIAWKQAGKPVVK